MLSLTHSTLFYARVGPYFCGMGWHSVCYFSDSRLQQAICERETELLLTRLLTGSRRENRKARKASMILKTSRKSGFTLVEIMIVVAIIGLLAAIAIPNFVKARTTSQANACINNLRQIDGAKQQWALEQKAAASATPTTGDLQPYLGRGSTGSTFPVCPASTTAYTIGDLATAPTCSLSGATPPHALP
jgi:prepilin-type N-terminal cleavage/methylation domain-containing protein